MSEKIDHTAKEILNFALAQVAAESFLDDVLPYQYLPEGTSNNPFNQRLKLGPSHFNHLETIGEDGSATQSTDLMIADFHDTWEVLFQLPNTESGFSATILLNKEEKQLTFSFRSTESLPSSKGGDFERDGGSGADGEIVLHGFAFGQISDMEKLYQQLYLGTGDLIAGIDPVKLGFINNILVSSGDQHRMNVTGYSLGGHLAQAFTLLHYDKVHQTVVFNGAGIGGLEGYGDGTLVDEFGQPTGEVIDGKLDGNGNPLNATIEGEKGYAAGLRELIAMFDKYMANPASAISDFGVESIAHVLKGLGGEVADLIGEVTSATLDVVRDALTFTFGAT